MMSSRRLNPAGTTRLTKGMMGLKGARKVPYAEFSTALGEQDDVIPPSHDARKMPDFTLRRLPMEGRGTNASTEEGKVASTAELFIHTQLDVCAPSKARSALHGHCNVVIAAAAKSVGDKKVIVASAPLSPKRAIPSCGAGLPSPLFKISTGSPPLSTLNSAALGPFMKNIM